MDWLYSALLKPFDWMLSLSGSFHPLLVLVLVSLFAGIVLLLVFARFSDQEALRSAKDRVRAHLLELRLFGHDAHLVWAAEKKIVGANLLYLRLILKPLVITLPIFAWMLFGLYGWFEFRPLAGGEAVVVSAFMAQPAKTAAQTPNLTTGEGLQVETPVLRIYEENRCDWRVRALEAGEHRLVLSTGKERFERVVAVGTVRRSRVSRSASPRTPGPISGGGDPRSEAGAIERVEIDYPRARLTVLGFEVGWVTVFIVLSVAFSFLLRRPLGVTF